MRDISDDSHAVLDAESRERKANKILTVLETRSDLPNAAVLDIGTGAGYIAAHIAKRVKYLASVDRVDERKLTDGYEFKVVADETLPFGPSSFDIVVSNHVIEHVEDQQKHVDEIIKVLRPGGLLYLATPNRLWITDPHYRVPFINWMPRVIATRYLYVTKGKTWDVRPVTTRRIRKHVAGRAQLEPIIVEIIKDPQQYHLDAFKALQPLTKRMPRPLLRVLSHASPTIIVVLKKSKI